MRQTTTPQERVRLTENEEGASAADVLVAFGNNTTVHGVQYALDRNSYKTWKRWLWAALVSACSGLMIWQIFALVKQYQSYEVTTTIRTIVPESLPFPAVTICDTNSVDYDILANATSEDDVLRAAPPADSLIFQAGFNGAVLNVTQAFKPVYTPGFGVCYEFETSETIIRPGSVGGLYFLALLDVTGVPRATIGMGLEVSLHQAGTRMTNEDPVLSLAPGNSISVQLQSKTYRRETQKPWSRCKGSAPEYTQSQCRTQCVDAAVRERCGCRRLGDRIGELEVCGEVVNQVYMESCPIQVWLDFRQVLAACDCHLPTCYEELFPATVHSLPVSQFFKDSFFGDDDDYYDDDSYDPFDYFFSVSINFESIQTEEYGETKEMTFIDLLAAIGGSMGLFAGISILGVVEVFGELGIMRLLPRCWGDRRLLGIGSVSENCETESGASDSSDNQSPADSSGVKDDSPEARQVKDDSSEARQV